MNGEVGHDSLCHATPHPAFPHKGGGSLEMADGLRKNQPPPREERPMQVSAPNPTLAEIDHAHGDDHSGQIKTYLRVFVSLAIFTAVEYFYARIFKDAFTTLVLGLMTWAIIKATLVGLYFMHLKYEGKWVLAMLVPAGILACVLVFALMPDIAMQPVTEINSGDEIEAEDSVPHAQRSSMATSPTKPTADAGKASH